MLVAIEAFLVLINQALDSLARAIGKQGCEVLDFTMGVNRITSKYANPILLRRFGLDVYFIVCDGVIRASEITFPNTVE